MIGFRPDEIIPEAESSSARPYAFFAFLLSPLDGRIPPGRVCLMVLTAGCGGGPVAPAGPGTDAGRHSGPCATAGDDHLGVRGRSQVAPLVRDPSAGRRASSRRSS